MLCCRQQVTSVKCTVHPNFPMRAVVICNGATVRILAPNSGEVLTTLLLDPQQHVIVDTAYSIADGEDCVCTVNGSLHFK